MLATVLLPVRCVFIKTILGDFLLQLSLLKKKKIRKSQPSTSIPEFSLFTIFKMADAPGITLVNADVPRDQILQDFWGIWLLTIYTENPVIPVSF